MLISTLCLIFAATPASSVTRVGAQGQLELASGVLSAPLQGELSEAARLFALTRRTQLGLPASSTLERGSTFATRFGGSVHLLQKLEGVPVEDAKVVVTVDAAKRVVRLASSVVSYKRAIIAWTLGPEQALERAAREVEGARLKSDAKPYGGASRRYFRVGDEVHAGYLVRLFHWDPGQAWYAGIDATNGQVLFVQNRTRRLDDAQVYASSPGGLDAGVGVTPTVGVVLDHLVADRDGGFLEGDQLSIYNCCPTQDCNPDAGAARSTGTFNTYNGPVPYDFAICQRRQRATNDPAAHSSGDYVYTPVDPPTSPVASVNEPADWDEFAEVHAFHHVNQVYDFVRGLSTGGSSGLSPFHMRDEDRGKQPAVWTNVTLPDFYNATNVPGVGYVSNTLVRQDNAGFMPLESMDYAELPEYALDVDTLMIYQGDKADFAYDAPVLWHEFGHGVIYSTANFAHVLQFDGRSTLDVAGALHEGLADYFAAAFGQNAKVGAYVGPRTGERDAIRDIEEDLVCPDSLWGESHQDGRFFSGALWDARKLFMGSDQGRTFDAAFFAALVSLTPNATFDAAAEAIVDQVAAAFPGITDAREQIESLFRARGALACSKVVDVTDQPAPREYYYVPGTYEIGADDGNAVPGPYQMKLRVPYGATSLTVSGPYMTFNSTSVRLQVLAKSGAPVSFSLNGSSLTHDADVAKVPTLASGKMSATLPVDVPCGGELYFTVGNTSRRGRGLTELAFSFEPRDLCDPVTPEPDAGTVAQPVSIAAIAEDSVTQGSAPKGCGCANAQGLALGSLLSLLGLAALSRRRRALL